MPATYNFPTIIQGDTFKRRTLTITVDGNPMDLTGAEVVMQLKSNHNAKPVHTFETEITNAEGGELALLKWDVNLEPYKYQYDLKIKQNNGNTLTYMAGTFNIKPTVSEWS